jgi:branched-chain amino acid transport system ATP-binding protein
LSSGTSAAEGTGTGTGALLEVRELTVHHGQLRAVSSVSLRLAPGDVYAIIGANGAGKSTLLRTISGLNRPTAGSVLLDGEDVTRDRPERRAAAGIVMVPEGRRLFPSLTVEENLLVGSAYARQGPWTVDRVYQLFDWMRERRRQRAAQLSGGEQQAVAIGRALVANPRVLLLDELSLGLAPVVVRRIYGVLPDLLAAGITVLLVEQDVSQALRVATRIHCLLEGRTTLEGTPAGLSPEQIEDAYFGLLAGNQGNGAGGQDGGQGGGQGPDQGNEPGASGGAIAGGRGGSAGAPSGAVGPTGNFPDSTTCAPDVPGDAAGGPGAAADRPQAGR